MAAVRVVLVVLVLLVVAACAESDPRPAVEQPATSPATAAPTAAVDLDRGAEDLVRFARGELATPPADNPVRVYLGGRLLHTIPSAHLADRSQWEGLCPEGGSYAARTCPFSVLRPMAEAAGRVMRFRTQRAEHPCAHPTPLRPAEVGASLIVTVVPDPTGSCVDWVAVELFVNDLSQVVATNVVWAEP